MRIGYYAHHHGSGHCRQADKLASLIFGLEEFAHLDKQSAKSSFTVFTSTSVEEYQFKHLMDEQIVRLPDEHETADDVLKGRAGQYWQPDCLHYSPVGNENIQARSTTMLSEIASRQIDIMIIDLSVEVALLCRVASIPYLYVRLPGDREDSPHLNAFAGALGLLAMYPAVLENKHTPEWVQQKTLHLGFLSQESAYLQSVSVIDSKQMLLNNLNVPADKSPLNIKKISKSIDPEIINQSTEIITVIKGYGGHKAIDAKLPLLRQAKPNAFILSLGPITESVVNAVDVALEVGDVTPFLVHSDMVVMACGLNAIAEVCQFDTPLVVLPANRPHDEQIRMAEALTACGRGISFDDFLSRSHSLLDSLQQKNQQPDQQQNQLQNQLREQHSLAFTQSMLNAKDAKSWFYEWLLPRLGLMPERMNNK